MCKTKKYNAPLKKKVIHEIYQSESARESLGIFNNLLCAHNYKMKVLIGQYLILQKGKTSNYIVWNLHKKYKSKHGNGHGHQSAFNKAVDICEHLFANNKPCRDEHLYNLGTYLRVSDKKYSHSEWIKDLMDAKIDKKVGNNHYYNSSKGVRVS